MKTKEDLSKGAAAIIKSGEKVLETETSTPHSSPVVNEEKFHEFRISALSFLSRVFGNNHTYYQSFKTEVTLPSASRTRRGLGIINAAKKEFSGDWLDTTRGLITKDILTDMLRLAKLQLDQENLKAATIITGAVVDELLRNLCFAAGIKLFNELQGKAVPKKALQLSGEAYKKKIYDRQENKLMMAWIELYNDAAENKDETLTPSNVKQMLSGVQSFLAKAQL
ncbi:MAG: hypothetical protein GY702_20770 [Desulfobulbaceae bacterium]|nr:hypothetical protein [Desulfobulbaceae bacterium]